LTAALTAGVLKEWRQIRRHPALVASVLFWPLLLPAVYVAQATAFGAADPRALEAFAARAGTAQVAGFVFVGWSTYLWLSRVLWGPGTSLRTEQLRGSLESVFLTPAPRAVVVLAPAVAALVPALLDFTVMAVALRVGFGVELAPQALARAAVVILLTVPAMWSIGVLFACAVLRFGEVGGLLQLVRGVLTIGCGVTYPIALLPDWARAIALALPPTHFVGGLRAVLLGGSELLRIAPDLLLLTALNAALSAVAVLAFTAAEHNARQNGRLGWG